MPPSDTASAAFPYLPPFVGIPIFLVLAAALFAIGLRRAQAGARLVRREQNGVCPVCPSRRHGLGILCGFGVRPAPLFEPARSGRRGRSRRDCLRFYRVAFTQANNSRRGRRGRTNVAANQTDAAFYRGRFGTRGFGLFDGACGSCAARRLGMGRAFVPFGRSKNFSA